MERLHILLPAIAHGNVFDDETLVTPCLHGVDVKFGIFGGNVEQRGAAPKRQPAIAVGKELLRHVVVGVDV
jgi:hypothetical protein